MEAIKREKWLHIIQPKINRNRKELIKERDQIAEKYLQQEYYIVDGYKKSFSKGNLEISFNEIAQDIEYIGLADVIVFASGWQNDWVCKIEHEIAQRSLKEIIDIN